jgi:hypothetical protein
MSTTASERESVPCSSSPVAVAACLFACSGRIRYLDGGNSPRGGSELAALVKARSVFLRPELFLLGDVAYVSDERVKTGWKAPQLDPATVGAAVAAQRRLYNQRLSALRIRIEHAFSRLKHTWQLFQHAWKLPLNRLAPSFRAAALLTNYLLVQRGLYM